jgi:hypothetical protein
MLEQVKAFGDSLCESRMWKPFVEDIENSFQRRSTAIVLENTRKFLEGLEETTKAISININVASYSNVCRITL